MAFCVWLVILMLASGYHCFSTCQGPIPRTKDPKCESQSCFSIEGPAGMSLVEASCWSGNGTEVLFRPGAGVEHLHLKMEMRKEECESEVRFVRYNVSLAEVEKGAWHQFVLEFVEVYQHHLYLHFHVTLDGRMVALVNSGYYKHYWRYNGYSVWVNGSVQYGLGCVTEEKPKENQSTARLHLHETSLSPTSHPSTRQAEEESTVTQRTTNATEAQQSTGSPRVSVTPIVAIVLVLLSALLISFLVTKKRGRAVSLRARTVTMGVSSLFQRRGPNDPYPVMLARE